MAFNRAAYKLRGDFARLNFPHLRSAAADFRPLHSSVDAKLQAICQTLSQSQNSGAGSRKAKKSSAAAAKAPAKPKVEESSSQSLVITSTTTESDGASAGSSSPLSATLFPAATHESHMVRSARSTRSARKPKFKSVLRPRRRVHSPAVRIPARRRDWRRTVAA